MISIGDVFIIYRIEIQNGNVNTERIVLNTIERAINFLSKLYLSAKANGVMANGMAACMIELEN
jgi:hypothetical protein